MAACILIHDFKSKFDTVWLVVGEMTQVQYMIVAASNYCQFLY